LQDHDKAAPSRSPDGALNAGSGGITIAQLVPGIDNTILIIIAILVIILIPAALILRRALKARSEEEGRAKRQRLDYQPPARQGWVPVPVPISWSGKMQQQTAAPQVPEVDVVNCGNIQESLCALVKKYSLDSFTIATSDGLVFASSGGETAQEDAAGFSRHAEIRESVGVALFGITHSGSDLTGIIRSKGIITGEIQKRIERDTKDILNRWI
jgi:hypothetical protein